MGLDDLTTTGRSTAAASSVRQRGKPDWYVPASVGAEFLSGLAGVAGVLTFLRDDEALQVSAAVAGGWVLVRALRGRYRPSELGNEAPLAVAVIDGLIMFCLLSVGIVAARASLDAGSLAVATTTVVICSSAWARFLHRDVVRRRRTGTAILRMVLVGEPVLAQSVADHLAKRSHLELVVVGVCPVGDGAVEIPPPVITRIPVQSVQPDVEARSVVGAAKRVRADVVAVVPGSSLHGLRLRHLAWEVHEAGLEFAVMPGVSEIRASRIDVRAVDGLALLRVSAPRASRLAGALKEVLDRAAAFAALALLLPLLAATAVLVKLDSPGPVFYRHPRIGKHGRPFTMWKFRTMVANAQELRADLVTANENNGLMFKVRRDPRITRVGRVLRRYSIDELPQLLNVLRGDMSLVGPRPPLPDEVARYNSMEQRRLRVKPGMTGMWQISGRSDLSWEETVSIDLRYIDNWTFAGDVDVLLRTARAVVEGRGAY
jgi:exopolysaccharide biosynthesis polyprenyl glycosylphosphotransferase